MSYNRKNTKIIVLEEGGFILEITINFALSPNRTLPK